MSAVAISASLGRITSGELDVIFVPRGGCHGKRAVLLFHGQLRTAQDWNDTVSWKGSTGLATGLAKAGLLVIAGYWGGPLWGNAATDADIEAARTLAATYGAATDKVLVLGASMGALESLSFASQYPSEVAAGVAVIPAVNLNDARDNNYAGTALANINTAFGLPVGSTSATVALPANADPSTPANAAAITAPFRFYGSSSDTTAPWSQVTSMVPRMVNSPGVAASDVSTGGHTDITIAAAPVNNIVSFLAANA